MKRILLSFVSLFIFSFANAQVSVFHENFEVVDSMASTGNPTWFQSPAVQVSGSFCMRDTIAVNDSSYLTSIAFSTVGNTSVTLDFWHICKISFADAATVEVSNDNGTSWVQLTALQYLSTSGFSTNNLFSSAVYGPTGTGWLPLNNLAVPTNTWWKHEVFNISSLVPNAPQVKIRFKLKDANFSGGDGTFGWLIDDVNVTAAPHELFPPHVAWVPPVLQGNVYNLGPYTISDTIFDLPVSGGCGLDTATAATLFYTINGGATVSVHMVNTNGNIFRGAIPALVSGDSVCYYVQAADTCGSLTRLPASGCISFKASSGIVFPYIDNFDVTTNLWTPADSSGTGNSIWELGTPAFGLTNSAHTNPNAWDINLTTAYNNQANAMLYSPVFSFSGIFNPSLSFWRNHFCEGGWDGTRLEYTIDAGASWQILGSVNDPNATNWYTDAQLNSSQKPAWEGNSGGWVQSTYKLGCLFSNTPSGVRFRFIFTSDFSVTEDGFTIDDFSILPAPVQDIGVAAILRPGAIANTGSSDTVRIILRNYGSQAASGFNINYSINGGAPVTQAFAGTLQPCDIDTILFVTPFTVPVGTYHIRAFTSLAGDADHTNDTIVKNPYGLSVVSLPYSDNLEGAPELWYDSSALGTNWEWGMPNFGATNSTHSGLKAWDTNLDTSCGDGARSVLTSPNFDFSTQVNAKLSFWMNRNIATGDGLTLEYSINGGTSWQRLGVVNDPNALGFWYNNPNINFTGQPGWDGSSGGWTKYLYILGPPFNNAGTGVRFRFIFTSNFFTISDGVSIDDFNIIPASPVDIGVTAITQPGNSAAAGSNATVAVTFRNYGTSTVTNTDIGYEINGTVIATEPWTGSLAPSASANFTFATQFVVPVGLYDICAFTSLVADGDHTNDTLCTTKHGIPLFPLPYFDNFDAGPVVWFDSSATGSLWELGTPNFGQTTGAHSTPNSWDINLNTAYANNAHCNLNSPLFDFTNIYNAKLSFWQNRRCENGWDGFRIDYSTNGGTTWQVLGTQIDPLGTNWYTDTLLNSSNLPAWEDMSFDTAGVAGWSKSTYKLVPLNNAGTGVMLKFVFTSDGSVTQDGASVDDFAIDLAPPQDASVFSIIQPSIYAPAGSSDSVKVIISNEGGSPISNFPVTYTINGVVTGTVTYTGTLQPSVHAIVTFPPFVVPTGYFDICAYTSLSGDGDHSNDTVCKTSFGIPMFPISYFDDFEGANVFFADNNDWQYGTPASNLIDSAYSPTHAWKTILAGNYSNSDDDNLYSPFFDFTNAFKAVLRFRHWYVTNAFADGGRVEYSSDAGQTWQTLGSVGDPNGTNWYSTTNINGTNQPGWQGNSHGYILSSYKLDFLNGWNTNYVQFRYNFNSTQFGVTNNGWAIDDFEIYNPITRTAAPILITGINNPFAITGPQTISTYIQNRGSFDLSAVDASLVVDGATIVTDAGISFSPPLVTGDSSLHTFSVPWSPTLGGHDLCVITSLPNGAPDLNPSDDTLCTFAGEFDSVTVITNSPPYCNDFESGNGHPAWIPLNAFNYALFDSDWELGTPGKTTINAAHSGVNAWSTKLAGNYSPRDSSGLFSPVFTVDTLGCYQLSFYHYFITETFQDGGTVEYSTNNGASWRILGYAFEPDWFNSLYVTGLVGGPPTAGWSGISNGGWNYAAHNIKFQNSGYVIFRFRFGSDLTNQQEGWTIDDVCFQKIGPCTIGIDELVDNSITFDPAFPNPASDQTYFAYSTPEHGKVRMYVTDVLGREVGLLVNESQSAGLHQVKLDVKDYADGMYYCTLEFGNNKLVRKFVVAR